MDYLCAVSVYSMITRGRQTTLLVLFVYSVLFWILFNSVYISRICCQT